MSKHKYQSHDLYEAVQTTSEIRCENCDAVDTTFLCEEPEDLFFHKGWRVTKSGKVYCPKCAKKKLSTRINGT